MCHVVRPFNPPYLFIKIYLTMNSNYEVPRCIYIIIFYTKINLEKTLPSTFFTDDNQIDGYGLHDVIPTHMK
jgi:hypothetical protein